MADIQVLDDSTIDKIAAGEVVDRPSSVVKELVENAIDAGAHAITVEIKNGGIEFIRVTDDGQGIEKEQVKKAFLRHATSKIKSIEDLAVVSSLGFRGEALSSIAAVSKVELITKIRSDLTGIRYCIEGAKEVSYEEIGAPEGTTFLVRNLFYNTPARRKFLKSAMTEGSYISDLMEHMALSKPMISFKFILNGQTKFFTSGDGDLRAIIYRIFGRETANETLPFSLKQGDMEINGFLGRPTINRSNRNYENYYVNNRYIRSTIMSKAIEEGYKSYLMQHKYPFCVIHLNIPSSYVDVNVHPTKMDVRFSNQNELFGFLSNGIEQALSHREMIPNVDCDTEAEKRKIIQQENKGTAKLLAPEPFEKQRTGTQILQDESAAYTANSLHIDNLPLEDELASKDSEVFFEDNRSAKPATPVHKDYHVDKQPEKLLQIPQDDASEPAVAASVSSVNVLGRVIGTDKSNKENSLNENPRANIIKAKDSIVVEKPTQLNLFEEKILTQEARSKYQVVGQIFDTYWLVSFEDKLLIIDQHAAHEKIKYEQIMKKVEQHEIFSQTLNPPVILHVTPKEEDILRQYQSYFEELGFEVEPFGGNAYALRSVPYELFGYNEKDLFEEILSDMIDAPVRGIPDIIRQKIASMACKAAVKGNMHLSFQEANALIDQLMSLDNPYNCPHGRPTIISMSKYEIEKKFKRIV